jgi:hypothetical protein
MMMLYNLELEVFCSEGKRTAHLTIQREIEGCLAYGQYLIINDIWEEVETVIHDVDQKQSILHLRKKIVMHLEFDHTIRQYCLKGWKLLNQPNENK